MKHRDTSFSLIFVAVILAHVGFIGWLVFGNNGCQHDLAASESATLTPEDKPPIQLNLSLSDRVKPEPKLNETEAKLPPRASNPPDDPESRLVLPKAPVAHVPPPEPIVIDDTAEKKREAAKQKALLTEQRNRAEEAEAKLALVELANAKQQREAEATRKRELAATKEKRDAAEAQRQRETEAQKQGARKEAAVLAAKAKRENDRQAVLLAQKRQAEEARKRKALEEELQREITRKDEKERLAETQRQRQATEETARRKRLADQLETKRKADKTKILAEQLERKQSEALRIEKAKIVGQPAVIKAKPIGEANGTGQAAIAPAIVPAKPKGGGGGAPAPVKVDMAGYGVKVAKKIRKGWTVPKGIAVDRRPEVFLRINRAGKVVYSRLSQKSGNSDLDRSAINAVQIGSELRPLPPGYGESLYEVKVKFEID